MSANYLDTPATFLDKLKGAALIATFLSITRIGVAEDRGESLSIREAAV